MGRVHLTDKNVSPTHINSINRLHIVFSNVIIVWF